MVWQIFWDSCLAHDKMVEIQRIPESINACEL